MNCPVCGKDEWHDLNYLRNRKYWYERNMIYDEKIGFAVCKECGYLGYNINSEDMKKRYTDQRNAVNWMHHVTGFRKLDNHMAFLNRDDFGDNVIDVGCGIGMFPFAVKKDKINAVGTEYSKALANYARGKYGLDIMEEIEDFNTKFSFISFYHVLEHIPNPDIIIDRAIKALSPGGKIYISVPIWLDKIINTSGGAIANDFEDYFHLNHCCCFTKTSFFNLLKMKKLKIVRKDEDILGMTVLCEYDESIESKYDIEKYESIVKTVEKIKAAIELFEKNKFGEAVGVFKRYPDAYIHKALNGDNSKNFQAQVEIIEAGLKEMPEEYPLLRQYAGVLLQWDGSKGEPAYSNNVHKAEEIFEKLVNIKRDPFCYESLIDLNMRHKKDYKKALYWINEYKKHDLEATKNIFGNEAYIYANGMNK
jgi:SAM-dependent methyltransferase